MEILDPTDFAAAAGRVIERMTGRDRSPVHVHVETLSERFGFGAGCEQCPEVRGNTVAWCGPDGTVDSACIGTDVLEVPVATLIAHAYWPENEPLSGPAELQARYSDSVELGMEAEITAAIERLAAVVPGAQVVLGFVGRLQCKQWIPFEGSDMPGWHGTAQLRVAVAAVWPGAQRPSAASSTRETTVS